MYIEHAYTYTDRCSSWSIGWSLITYITVLYYICCIFSLPHFSSSPPPSADAAAGQANSDGSIAVRMHIFYSNSDVHGHGTYLDI